VGKRTKWLVRQGKEARGIGCEERNPIPTAPSTHEEASSTVVPYRLYKWRWVGVVAMVNPFQLFLILG